MKRHYLSLLLLTVSFLPMPVAAQINDNSQTMERMDRLERDIMLLQRQLSRGGTGKAGANLTTTTAGGSAGIEVHLSALEEELRALRGKIEENEFQTRKVAENLEKLQKDMEFRFSELSGNPPLPGNDTPMDASGETPMNANASANAAESSTPATASDTPTSAGDGVLRPPGNDDSNFATPREHYNYAFRLLNQTQYEQAAQAFDAFTKKYPKDPLVGNAYYWQGETYYIRRDYVNAADNFRQGFEALPDGPKAADNLLKLGMSLDALGRDKEACVVLQQIVTKFKKSSTSVTQKADQEQKRIGCK